VGGEASVPRSGQDVVLFVANAAMDTGQGDVGQESARMLCCSWTTGYEVGSGVPRSE